MTAISIPIEIELTPRSRAVMEALQRALAPQFQAAPEAPAPTSCTPALNPGERYAGAVLDEDGNHLHHLVLLPQRPSGELNWQAAVDWAKSVGGELPTRQEQALLFANCKKHLPPGWHWSSETHADDASHAWICYFTGGSQSYSRKSYDGCAVAVRRA